MKKLKKHIFGLLNFIFTVIAPFVIICIAYVSERDYPKTLKVSFGGLILLLIAGIVTIRFLVKRFDRKKTDLIAEIAKEFDMDEKKQLVRKYDRMRLLQAVYDRLTLILPFLVLFLLIGYILAAGQKFRAVLGLIIISMVVGGVFALCELLPKKKKEKGNEE